MSDERAAIYEHFSERMAQLTHPLGNGALGAVLGYSGFYQYLGAADAALLAGDEKGCKQRLNDGYRAVKALLVKEK